MKANIQSVHFTADQKLIDFIQMKLDKLERFNSGITDASVILKLENSGQVKDKIAEVIISVPGNRLIGTATNKSFEQSIDESMDALERQLRKIKGKQQDAYKSMRR